MADHDGVLQRHRLAHVATLRADPLLFTTRFASDCQTTNCRGGCCQWGVLVDLEERDAILANADRVQQAMDDSQDHDPQHWFDTEGRPDPDFPSGRTAGTRAVNDHCVFLDSSHRCTLQRLSEADGAVQLKPFFCRLYPLTLEFGVLTLDNALVEGQPQCCSATAAGERTIFEACPGELDLVLDAEGVRELRHLAGIQGARST